MVETNNLTAEVAQWKKDKARAIKFGAEIDPKYMQIQPNQCQDGNGKWLKWVPERITTQV